MEAWKVKTIRLELAKSPRLKSINTQQNYFSEIKAFELWRDDRPISGALIELYLKELREAGKTPNKIYETFSILRWWVRRLAYLAQYSEVLDPQEVVSILIAHQEVEQIQAFKLEPPKQRNPLSEDEFSALIECCLADTTPAGARDRAIFYLAYHMGLLLDEITGLDLEDLETEDGGEHTLTIRATGNVVRKVLLDEKSYLALVGWLAIRGNRPGALFCCVFRRGKLKYRNLSRGTLQRILDKRFNQAGIRHLTWGDFKVFDRKINFD